MSIITLTTDWCEQDHYVALTKARILKQHTTTQIIDISHQVKPFSVLQAVFVIRQSYKEFPEGSIHIIGVDSHSKNGKYVFAKHNGHFFIGADNGFLSLLFHNEKPNEVYYINTPENNDNQTFPELTVFAECACKLLAQTPTHEYATETQTYVQQTPLLPTLDNDNILGTVIYTDSYKNTITNISKDFFLNAKKNRNFEIILKNYKYRINKINKTYNAVKEGELVAVFNAAGLLEIAMNKGKVAELLNLKFNDSITIRFSD